MNEEKEIIITCMGIIGILFFAILGIPYLIILLNTIPNEYSNNLCTSHGYDKAYSTWKEYRVVNGTNSIFIKCIKGLDYVNNDGLLIEQNKTYGLVKVP